MRHFGFLDTATGSSPPASRSPSSPPSPPSPSLLSSLFQVAPQPFRRDAGKETLARALGATLYSPATRPELADIVARRFAEGVMSMVLCLEDAIADHEVAFGEDNLVRELTRLARRGGEGPLLFVRVRAPEQVTRLVARLGEAASVLTGFVLPKFTELSGAPFLDAVADVAQRSGLRFFAMPVLESPQVMYAETRVDALAGIRLLLDKHRDNVLAVRIGATDLCGAYGLRRSRDLTVYDIAVIRDAITDIVNVFARADESGFVVSGCVWEYFTTPERMFKPQLRRTPFEQHGHRLALRDQLITQDLDGLIREVVLDKANGLIGKTVIHPTHVRPVHSLLVVTAEEYDDATSIHAAGVAGGVQRSGYANKMNELKPHRAWAEATLARAAIYGVAAEGVTFVELLAAGESR